MVLFVLSSFVCFVFFVSVFTVFYTLPVPSLLLSIVVPCVSVCGVVVGGVVAVVLVCVCVLGVLGWDVLAWVAVWGVGGSVYLCGWRGGGYV